MANASSLKFVVEVQADQADRAMKSLATSFNEAGVAFRAQAQTMGSAAKSAGAEVISLGDKIKQVARDQRSEARAASFYVQELAAIAPVSASAKVALGGLIEAMVGGAGIGAAIAITTTAIKLMTAAWAEEEAAAKKAQDERDKYTAKINADVEANRRRGYTPGENIREQIEYTRMRIDDKSIQAGGLAAAIEAEKQSMGADWFKINKWQKDLDELTRDIESAKAALRELDAKLRTEVEANDRESAIREANKAARSWKDVEIKSFDASEPGAYRYNMPSSGDRTPINLLPLPEGTKGGGREGLEAAARLQKEYNDELKKTTALYERWGNQVADIAIGLATQRMTGTQAIQAIATMLVQQMAALLVQKAAAALAEHTLDRNLAISNVSEKSAMAGAAAAAQVAETPAFAAAPAVGAAITAAVMAEMMPFAVAARGWDIPAGGPFPALLHSREMVLPAKYADVIRQGGGGGGVTVNVAGVIDGRNLERALTANDGPVARAERKRLRRRRV